MIYFRPKKLFQICTISEERNIGQAIPRKVQFAKRDGPAHTIALAAAQLTVCQGEGFQR